MKPGRHDLLDLVNRQVDAQAGRSDRAEAPARAALLTGVFASAVFLATGLAATLLRGEPRPDRPPAGRELISGCLHLQGIPWLYVGLLILAATPVLRVAVMAWVYLRRRERFMLLISLIVLCLLGVSIWLGTG